MSRYRTNEHLWYHTRTHLSSSHASFLFFFGILETFCVIQHMYMTKWINATWSWSPNVIFAHLIFTTKTYCVVVNDIYSGRDAEKLMQATNNTNKNGNSSFHYNSVARTLPLPLRWELDLAKCYIRTSVGILIHQ